ncbi:MAG TPA: sigma-70 family RNA polymerase sigma factor [Phycisphaerae bacterium]|nr:sigma-70 family RNA polymerase sigma factor [Phycisphaerae bacterium]
MTSDLSGDCRENWNLWLRKHLPAMVLFARQWAAGRPDAEDAVQMAFAEFWPQRDKVDDALAFVYSRTRRRAIDLSRRQARRSKYERTPMLQAIETNQTSELENAQRTAMIEKVLQKLPEAQREVIVLKIWGGLSFSQIAETLEISANTAASRYRCGLARLQESLAQEVKNE